MSRPELSASQGKRLFVELRRLGMAALQAIGLGQQLLGPKCIRIIGRGVARIERVCFLELFVGQLIFVETGVRESQSRAEFGLD